MSRKVNRKTSHRETRTTSRGAAGWLLLGLGAGSVLAAGVVLLTAPWKGTEARGRLRRWVGLRATPEQLENAYDEVRAEARRHMHH